MDTISATLLAALTAADGLTPRESTNEELSGASVFEQLLEQELALITLETAQPLPLETASEPTPAATLPIPADLLSAGDVSPAVADVPLAAPEAADATINAQGLYSVLAPGTMLPSGQELHSMLAADSMLAPGQGLPTADLSTSVAATRPQNAATTRAATVLVTPEGAALPENVQVTALSGSPAPDAEPAVAAEATTHPVAETLDHLGRTEMRDSLNARATREPRETPVAATETSMFARAEERALHRMQAGAEQVKSEPLRAAFTLERFAAAELTGRSYEAALPTDTLSSVALLNRWAPPQHSRPAETAPAPATARIDTALGVEGWSEAFRQKIVWLVDRQQQSAELHLNPPHLGPVEVKLDLSQDSARISFCSPHAAVRETIEASLADLKTSLAERGLALGEALVSADPRQAREQFQNDAAAGSGRGREGSAGVASDPAEKPTHSRPAQRGLIDTFA